MKNKKIIIIRIVIGLIVSVCLLMVLNHAFWRSIEGAGIENEIDITQHYTADNGVELEFHIYSSASLHHQFLTYNISIVGAADIPVSVLFRDPDESVFDNLMDEFVLQGTENGVSHYVLGEENIYISEYKITTDKING